MAGRARSTAGAAAGAASGSGRGGGGGGAPKAQASRGRGAAAAAAAEEAEPRLPRGMRETAALLRANGYGVLNEEKLRNHRSDACEAAAPRGDTRQQQPQQQQQQQAQRQQQRQQPQPQQQQRQVRLVEPAADRRRGAADKRKHADSSGSQDERPARGRGAPPPPQQQQVQQPLGLKRVRSSWKMRPLLVDEKLAVFLEGRDDGLLHYDGGEFHQWLQDCESGAADPADTFPYPLVVQDRDLRTLLEIKPPGEGEPPGGELAAVPATAAGEEGGIIVPTVRLLDDAQQPDNLVREQDPPVVQRMQDSEQPDVVGQSAAAQAASAAWRSAERAVALDPPYIRYVQPTPDDLDLAVEYDLDEEDEEWLEEFNAEARRAKSRKGRRTLGEEWMEHLIDRMEKEYTTELQRHPGKWVVQVGDPGGTEPPAISIPSISEVFPLEKCLQVPGINHYENVIEAVYLYWRAKHERAGRPLIQRLWYEPPWDRRKAAQRLASSAADGEAGGSDDGPFYAQDSPAALAGIRKRRMDPEEVKARFQEMRRDLESARTLADQVRKREKLKKRELQLYKEEWAARMQAIHDGAERVVLRQGRVKDPPAQLSAVWRMEAFGPVVPTGSEFSDELSDEHLAMGAPQDAAAQAEDRAARVAMRRYARDAALGLPVPRQQQQKAAVRARSGGTAVPVVQRKAERPHARAASARAPPASPILHQGGNVRGPPAARGVKRVPVCMWCHSDEFHLLGCAACHRCFCFKCFQRRPGLGVNNWSRAVKDAHYRCVICRGLEVEDAPSANTADALPAADAADATSPLRAQQRARQQQQQQQRSRQQQRPMQQHGVPNNRAEAEAMGIEVPRGLGGAALRSFFLRQQREEQEAEQGGGPSSQDAVPTAPKEHHELPSRQRPSRRHVLPTAGSSDEEEEPRPKQRKLGGAALAAHLKRLEQKQQERQQAAVAAHRAHEADSSEDEAEQGRWQQQQAAQLAALAAMPSNRAEAEAMGIELPRGLGGAALRSFLLRRQELLAQEAGDSDSEQPASSGHGAVVMLEEEEQGSEPSAGSSGTALGAAAGGGDSDAATSGQAAASRRAGRRAREPAGHARRLQARHA